MFAAGVLNENIPAEPLQTPKSPLHTDKNENDPDTKLNEGSALDSYITSLNKKYLDQLEKNDPKKIREKRRRENATSLLK